ncbi:glycosyltransferase family 4 protein [Patescibacteria group bacterium]|nr:glycosyltransferase family 4 protein [Patescibacteria group bacterium]
MAGKKLKVAIVIQRYGLEVAGGAEMMARWVAEHMTSYWDVTVLTTKAKDYVTWKNKYTRNEEILNGVKIKRFEVDETRNNELFDELSLKMYGQTHTRDDEKKWVEAQGPKSTQLIEYLKTKANSEYDAFIFFQYLYYPTVFGMPYVKDKAFFSPAAHNEPPVYLSIYTKYFNMPLGLIPNAIEELDLIKRISGGLKIPVCVIGTGINVPEKSKISVKNLKRFNLRNSYILYLGRIEPGKGSDELFYMFTKFKQEHNIKLDLVLAGKAVVDIPNRKDIKYVGYVSEEEKFSLVESCEFLINPSRFESLSIVIMEAWLLKKAVLVNGNCDVLVGQCKRSNGGLWYTNYDEFESSILWLLDNKVNRTYMGKNGKRYVLVNYSWNIIEKKFKNFVESCLKKSGNKIK